MINSCHLCKRISVISQKLGIPLIIQNILLLLKSCFREIIKGKILIQWIIIWDKELNITPRLCNSIICYLSPSFCSSIWSCETISSFWWWGIYIKSLALRRTVCWNINIGINCILTPIKSSRNILLCQFQLINLRDSCCSQSQRPIIPICKIADIACQINNIFSTQFRSIIPRKWSFTLITGCPIITGIAIRCTV